MIVNSDFLDPFLPSRSQNKYFQVPEDELKKALTAELNISYRTQTRHIDAFILCRVHGIMHTIILNIYV